MNNRRVLLYFAWSRPAETEAPIFVIEDRFPAVFELRRIFYPKFEHLADRSQIDQGIGGFLDHIQKPNFQAFAQLAQELTGNPVLVVERVTDMGVITPLDEVLVGVDTLVVISFDSLRTGQAAGKAEIDAVRDFLTDPDHLAFVCPHHDIGEGEGLTGEASEEDQLAEYRHHGDHGIPPRQGFGGFARTLLSGMGVPIVNRFGLKPETTAEGVPAPAEINRALDQLGLLGGVDGFNSHPHLPQLERVGAAIERMGVLARQPIDPTAPAHPFTRAGRSSFDALLQSSSGTFAGKLLVCDSTMFSSTAEVWRTSAASGRTCSSDNGLRPSDSAIRGRPSRTGILVRKLPRYNGPVSPASPSAGILCDLWRSQSL